MSDEWKPEAWFPCGPLTFLLFHDYRLLSDPLSRSFNKRAIQEFRGNVSMQSQHHWEDTFARRKSGSSSFTQKDFGFEFLCYCDSTLQISLNKENDKVKEKVSNVT